MSAGTWTLDEAKAFVAGRRFLFVDGAALTLEPPAWLLEVADGFWPLDIGGSFAAAHRDDQQPLMNWFVHCAASPGEVQDIALRYCLEGEWVHARMRGLNLLDHPDVGGLILWSEVVGPADVDDIDQPELDDNDQVHWMIVRLDTVGQVEHIEGRVLDIVGRPAEELIGQRVTDYISAGSAADIVPMWLSLMRAPGSSRSVRRCFVHPDGRELWTECTYVNRFGPDGDGHMFMLAYDITVRREQEAAIVEGAAQIRRLADESRLLAEDFRMLADEVPSAVFRCDADGRVTFHNARWEQLMGDDRRCGRVHDAVHPDDHARLDGLLAEVAGAADHEARTVEVADADGARVLAIRCRSIADADGTNRRIVGSVDDISATARLRQEVRRDPLTGLLNRAGLREELSRAVHDDPSTVVLFLDLDRFKLVNDTMSHEAGDVVLQEVARRLERGTRSGDAVARYGGDEFVVVCRQTDDATPADLADRFRRLAEGPVAVPGGTWVVRTSIGAARPTAHDDPGTVLNRADLAMFADKDARRAGEPAATP